MCQVLNNNAKEGVRVVGHWAGGDAAYVPLRPIYWPGGVMPDSASRVVRIMVPLPFTGSWTGGKVANPITHKMPPLPTVYLHVI